MSDRTKRRKHHRGRRKKTARGGRLASNIVLVVAIVVFAVSAYQLIKIGKGYLDGRSTYKKVNDLTINDEKAKEDKFVVNFEELIKMNPDTVGWIRFYPEPSTISYPVVQGKDNQEYLHQTFEKSKNASGAIFLDIVNNAGFADRNSIIYGHRMKDGSMFRHLADYDNKAFWEEQPYFYLYTTSGKMYTYRIFMAGTVHEASDIYTTQFASDEEYEAYIQKVKEESLYDTGVEVKADDTIVTLSTCTAQSDENRFVVCGVKVKESNMGE